MSVQTQGGGRAQAHSQLELEGGGWSAPCPGHFTPKKRPATHCTVGWVGLRALLGATENLASTGIRSLDRPARSE
jgi:hypothetical protein